ncbi:MAG: DNA-3-methyladenine glycosylase I [Moraxellaceae bacterium]|nr:MAG: DNA-3-methyladenine glycosylase I [Moraxellaceae bacterium]
MKNLQPCPWAQGELYLDYHNKEWGKPCFDDQRLFEKICLEGQQAGLSWITVLKKRDHYRQRFFQFKPTRVAAMTDKELEECLTDAGLIRNRLKIYAIRKNALAYIALTADELSFSEFIWSFVGGEVKVNHFRSMKDMPSQTVASEAMSKALKRAGFTFVGPTICYAFMQSMGLVNDHLVSCPQHPKNTKFQ